MRGNTLTAENIIVGSTNLITEINGLEMELSGKQNILTQGNNITIDENNVISSNSDITQSDLDLKQNTLTYDNDLVLNSIVVKPRFTKENYTPAEDGEIRCDILTVADVNISTLISSKQDTLVAGTNITIVDNVISSSGTTTINDGDSTIAKSNVLKEALDSTAKLDSVNTFTGTQTIVGDLKVYNVSVKNTTPT